MDLHMARGVWLTSILTAAASIREGQQPARREKQLGNVFVVTFNARRESLLRQGRPADKSSYHGKFHKGLCENGIRMLVCVCVRWREREKKGGGGTQVTCRTCWDKTTTLRRGGVCRQAELMEVEFSNCEWRFHSEAI